MSITTIKGFIPATARYCRFILVLKGSLTAQLNVERFDFSENDIFMIDAGSPLPVLSSGKNIVIILSLNADFLEYEIKNFAQIKCNSRKFEFKIYDQLIRAVAELARGYFAKSDRERLFILSSLFQFLHVLSTFRLNISMTSSGTDQGEDKFKSRVADIKRYIAHNFSKPLTMNELAEAFHLTPQYLSKFIKQQFEANFTDYLTAIRLDNAVYDLLNSDETITIISFNNGFPNLTAFNKSFRERYNTTPLKYRKNHPFERTGADYESTNAFDLITAQEQFEVNAQLDLITSRPTQAQTGLDTITFEKIQADCSRITPLMSIGFDVINLGFAENILSHDFQKQLIETQNELKFKYGRFQSFIEPGIIDKMPNSKTYNFAKANRIIDFLYSINLLPCFEIGTKPRKINISSDEFLFYSEGRALFHSLEEWESFLQGFLINCINRYGKTEVEKWRFELWCSHGDKLEYTDDRINEFIDYFQVIHRISKSLLPSVQLGGFGFNLTASLDVFKTVLQRLSIIGLELDFLTLISFHLELREPDHADQPYFTTDSEYLSHRTELFRQALSGKQIPIYLSEWNFDFTSRDFVNDSVFKALFIAKNLLENTQHVDSVAYWLLSDITSEYKDTNKILFGGNGLLTVDGLKKPAFYAYQFLSRLGNHVIKRGPGYIVTSDANNAYQIFIYHYVHPSDFFCYKYDIEVSFETVNQIFEPTPPKEYSIELNHIASGNYRIKTYSISKDHGSILDEWLKMGAIQNVAQGEIDYFKSIAIPSQNIYYARTDEKLVIHDLLNSNEIHFISVRLEI